MSTVVVLGAGPIGAATASQLGALGVARRVVLVDAASNLAQGLALDMQQAAAVTGSSSQLEGSGDVAAVIGAAVVVVADRPGGAGEWAGDGGLALLRSVRGLNARALVLCAGPGQGGLIETLVREPGADRRLVVGTAPEALRHGVRTLTALAADVAPADVSVTVVGRPPGQLFVAWSGSSIAGSPAIDVLDPPTAARLEAQAARLWPPGPLALGAAAASVTRRYLTGAPGVVNLLLLPPDDRDRQRGWLSLPATLEASGAEARWPVLSPRDQRRLDGVAYSA